MTDAATVPTSPQTTATTELASQPAGPVPSSPVPSTLTTSVTSGSLDQPTTVTTTTPIPSVQTDRTTIHLVVLLLGIVAIVALLSGTYLIDQNKAAADTGTLFTLAGAAVGALGGLLAHTGSSS